MNDLSNTKKHTIAFYSDTNQLGGSEVYLKIILDGLKNLNYRVIFFCPTYHPLRDRLSGQTYIELVEIPGRERIGVSETKRDIKDIFNADDRGLENPRESTFDPRKSALKALVPNFLKLFLGTLKDICRLRNIFKQHKVDLIHFNDTGCEPPVIAARLAGIRNIIGTFHVLPSYDKEKTDWVRKTIEFFSVRSLHKVISVSQATKLAWVERVNLSQDNIRVIYNGIDLKRFTSVSDIEKQEIRLRENMREQDIVCGVPARLHPMKGHKYLIEAVPEIIKRIPDLKILFIGEGDLKEELILQVQKNDLQDTIRFLGHREDVRDLLNILDLVILPSVALEALPLSIIEAMACEKAVVASNFSGIPEVVEDKVTGLLVPPGNPEAIAQAIIELLSDSARSLRMGQAGRRRAKSMFTQERMLKETLELYRELTIV